MQIIDCLLLYKDVIHYNIIPEKILNFFIMNKENELKKRGRVFDISGVNR
jgi:hypothetical protein